MSEHSILGLQPKTLQHKHPQKQGLRYYRRKMCHLNTSGVLQPQPLRPAHKSQALSDTGTQRRDRSNVRPEPQSSPVAEARPPRKTSPQVLSAPHGTPEGMTVPLGTGEGGQPQASPAHGAQ